MRLPCRTVAFLFFAILNSRLSAAQTSFQFAFTAPPGAHAVGLRVIERYDRTRSLENAGQRPLQLLLWYPAEHSAAKPMTLGEYAALVKTETSFGKPVDHGKQQDFVAQFTHGLDTLSMRAVRDARPEAARFPLVIYAPSYNAPNTENIELCEYLASHGYVVMASPSLGASASEMTLDAAGADAQAADIEFGLSEAKNLPDVDPSEIAAVGYSWGGTAALGAAARDKRVRALVGLDSSFLYGPLPWKNIHPDQLAIPLLIFSLGEEPLAFRDSHAPPDTQPINVLRVWTQGDLLHVEMLAASHLTFSSMYQRSERFREEAWQFTPADYCLQEGAESYNWMARYMLEFLEVYLSRNSAAELFLRRTPAENGIPPHLLAAYFRAATNKPSEAIPARSK